MSVLSKKVDVLVIGGGPGGYVSAIRFSQLGKKVALVERDALGGTCLNRGCMPTKMLLHAGKIVWDATHAERIGIKTSISIDFSKTQGWSRIATEKRRRGVEYLCSSNGIDVVKGVASFASPNSVVVQPQGEQIQSDCILIATGSKPCGLPSMEPDSQLVLNSDDIFKIDKLPNALAIVGGGIIGVEMATAFASLGTRVTIVEIMDQILPGLDAELIAPVLSQLKRMGVDVRLKTKVVEILKRDGEVQLSLDDGGKPSADRVLLAVGRSPNIEDLNLGAARVTTDKKGFVMVNDRFETTTQGIYAIGDVTGIPFLAHRAMEEGVHAAEVACGVRDMNPRPAMPSVVYTDPEIATVGMGEEEAKKRGYDVVVGKFPFTASGRAQTIGRLEGFVKLVADRSGGTLLGAQMVGPDVSELIGECSAFITCSTAVEEIASGVHPHPTLGEAIPEAAKLILGKPIHFADI